MATQSRSGTCIASSMGVPSRLAVMRLEPMPSVIELHLARDSASQLDVVVGIAIRHGGNRTHLGAEDPQQLHFLVGLRFRNNDHATVAAGAAYVREADPGVACGAFDHGATGLKRAALLRVPDDVQRGAILDRTARVQKLGFAQNLATCLAAESAKTDQRRVTNGAGKTIANFHACRQG